MTTGDALLRIFGCFALGYLIGITLANLQILWVLWRRRKARWGEEVTQQLKDHCETMDRLK